MADLWFRSPSNYIREVIEIGENKVIFDIGFMIKRRITDVNRFLRPYFGVADYRAIIVWDDWSPEYGPKSDDPVAVYPTWQYGEDAGLLEKYLYRNVADDPAYTDPSRQKQDRPIPGQEHRVIISNFPNLDTAVGKSFLRELRDLQLEYPNVLMHIHGTYAINQLVKMGFTAMDMDGRTQAANGYILFPTGKRITTKQQREPYKDWIKLLGFKPVDLDIPRNRCMFNMKAM
jgi:hypothetical protein